MYVSNNIWQLTSPNSHNILSLPSLKMSVSDKEFLLIESDSDSTLEVKPANKKKSDKPTEIRLSESTIEGIAKYILEKPCKNIVVLSGAGVSTNSGLPDMRSPRSGLYYRLDPDSVPYPHAMFEIRFFLKNPMVHYKLMSPLLVGNFRPTLCHYFITLLQKKNVLLKNYTQNVDDLEKHAGVDNNKLGQINGSFNRYVCLMCSNESSSRWVKSSVGAGRTPRCSCGGIIKPNIFFYGEALPQLFCHNMAEDMRKCDLLIILGSSLSDEPVASMPFLVGKKCPRLVINGMPLSRCLGFDFSSREPKDVFWQGDCEVGCLKLIKSLGWTGSLHAILQNSLNGNLLRQSSENLVKLSD